MMKILVHFGYQPSKHLTMFSLLRDGGVFPLAKNCSFPLSLPLLPGRFLYNLHFNFILVFLIVLDNFDFNR